MTQELRERVYLAAPNIPAPILDKITALVLEEAARVAEDEACHCEDTGSAPSDFGNAGRNDAARTIATAIRAMKEKH